MAIEISAEAVRPVVGEEVRVLVQDRALPYLEAEFRYAIEMPEDRSEPGGLHLKALEVRLRADASPALQIDAQLVRLDIRWGKWLRAARSVAAEAVETELWEWADDGEEQPRVDRNEPRRKGEAPYEMVASLYRELVGSGARAPAREIAGAYGVSEGTARSWIHRARLRGYLGPANDRAAGETGFGARAPGGRTWRAGSTSRPLPSTLGYCTNAEFRTSLRAELESFLMTRRGEYDSIVDITQAMIELGVGVFSRYERVVDADGTQVGIQSALARIGELVEQLLPKGEEEDPRREVAGDHSIQPETTIGGFEPQPGRKTKGDPGGR